MTGVVMPLDKDKDDINKLPLRDPQNAGQVGVLWSLRVGFDDILLVGFDSLWTNRRKSYTDQEKRGKRSEAAKEKVLSPERWKTGWDNIFKEFPEARITARCPEGKTLSDERIFRDAY